MNFFSDDLGRLLSQENFQTLHDIYVKAEPYPHIVLDAILKPNNVRQAASMFPQPDSSWWKYDNALERKLAKNNPLEMPDMIRILIMELNSYPFIKFVEKVTGITGLIPDPSLNGAGMHQIARGGKLDIHCDYNYHPVTKLDRRVNVLLYMNTEWKPEWKGQLELWDKDMQKCVKSIDPILNRMVIFSTTDHANHGHPEPLDCPVGITRKSIALYYYPNGRPYHEKNEPHSTLFKRRPHDPIIQEIEELRQKRNQGRLA